MDETSDSEKDIKRERRRLWLLLGGTVLFMLGLVAYIIFFYDIAPPDDAWILPKPFPPSSGPNSIPEFVKDARKLLETSFEERTHLKEEDRLVSGNDLTNVRAYLQRHQEALKRFNAFLAVNQGPLPFPGGDKGLDLGADLSYLLLLQHGANLASMHARILARDGKIRESIDQSLILLRLGRQLSQECSGAIQWLVATTVQNLGRSSLEYAGNLRPFAEPELDLIDKTLSKSEAPPQDYKLVMEGEYLGFKRSLAKMPKGPSGALSGIIDFPPWAGYSLKPNMTLDAMMEWNRPIFGACNQDWCKTLAAATAVSVKVEDRQKHHRILRMVNANIGGNLLLEMGLFQGMPITEKSVRMAAYLRQMQIMTALRRYDLEHGTLPEKLEMLCPKFLPSVPLDPYDNQPMRWNWAKKAVYALGKDLHDDGGDTSRPSKKDDKDIGMFYWWAKPTAAP